jgi:hypothetical protein
VGVGVLQLRFLNNFQGVAVGRNCLLILTFKFFKTLTTHELHHEVDPNNRTHLVFSDSSTGAGVSFSSS